ncbi:MAG TPA: hypothetical protein VNJ08_17295 [Bacteriovoracaceae bacterium]|nr:hypothetical protein [Bacteriovoracaceae bacterium]
MENKGLKVIILNLSGTLKEGLAGYLTQRGILVINPDTNSEEHEWSHILTSDLHDFSLVSLKYQTIVKDIKIISLTAVNDPQNFMLANGKLILNEVWMMSQLGGFILDKFFQEYAGITMGDNYPKFQETGFFNITNPFSTGDNLDKLVHKAFQSDFAALSVKTYFDHIVMYLSGLKKKGKVGLPIEVTYGNFDDVFGVQLHFFADGLTMDDITGCLSRNITKKAEDSLLNISVQSADFFDFTFLNQVKKVVVTALWTKDERVTLENRGMMFTSLSSAATLTNLTYEGLSSQLMDTTVIEDMSSKVILPVNQVVAGTELSETLAEKISSDMEMEQIQQILRGEDNDIDSDKTIVGSMDEMEELVNIVKGSLEEEAEAYKVSGSKLDVDNFALKISAGVVDKTKGNLSYKSLGQRLPETIKTGLFDFAIQMGKDAQDLSEADLHMFKSIEVPRLIKEETIIGNPLSKQLRNELKAKLEEGLKNEFGQRSANSIISAAETPEDVMRVKQVLKSTLKSSLESNFQLNEKGITEVEKEILVKSLSASLSEDEDKIRDMTVVSGSTAGFVDSDDGSLFDSFSKDPDSAIANKLKATAAENELLKNKLKTVMVEIKILKDSRSQIAAMQTQIKQAAASMVKLPKDDQDANLRKHFQERLAQDEVLNQQEQKKLSMLMEREAKLVESSKAMEIESRKLQIESSQKVIVFTQELEKANRNIKTKDLMLNKTKEALQKLSEKKDSEIINLKQRLSNVTTALNSGPSQAHNLMLKDLEKQNQSLNKMVEMYKTKVSSMANDLQSNKDDGGTSKDEVRKLQMTNNQFKNQIDAAKKEMQKFQDKIAFDQVQITNLRAEKSKVDQIVKKLTLDLKKDQYAAQNPESDIELRKAQGQIQVMEGQFKELSIRYKETETRLSDALKSVSKHVQVDDGSKKVAHLENSVKKLNSDVVEARNQAAELKKETNKLRQEKTAMQNLLDKMKKDNDKATKGAPPKKPDSGGKAA